MTQTLVKSHETLYDPQTGSKLLTLKEAAKYLDYHPYSVYRLVSQGVLKPQKIGGKNHLFLPEELDRYKLNNEWAARKAAIKHESEAVETKQPLNMKATINIDLGQGFLYGHSAAKEDFSWQDVPLIRAELTEKYGSMMKAFEITVNNPDGWIWHISIEPPTILEKLWKKIKEPFSKNTINKGRKNV